MSEFIPLLVLFTALLIISPLIIYFHHPKAAIATSVTGVLLLAATLAVHPNALKETHKELSDEWQRKGKIGEPK